MGFRQELRNQIAEHSTMSVAGPLVLVCFAIVLLGFAFLFLVTFHPF
jgi:hypothetical protein